MMAAVCNAVWHGGSDDCSTRPGGLAPRMTPTNGGQEAAPALSSTRLRLGKLLGLGWIGASLTLLGLLLVDDFTHEGGLQPFPLALVGVELAIPVWLGTRLLRRPTRRLAMWSGWLALLAFYGSVIFAADAGVSGRPNPAASVILAGSLVMLVLSVTTARLYRKPKQPQATS
jgi:hypothetical protein